MRQLIAAAACAGLLVACGTEGAGNRQSGVLGDGAGAVGIEDSIGTGRTGTGTTGAQAGGSGGTQVAGGPDTGASGSSAASAGGAFSAVAILSQIAVADETEIAEAKAAQRQARSADVKALARTLERDHTAALKQVQTVQARLGAKADPAARANAQADADHAGHDPAGTTGADFDATFLERQRALHEENIRKLETTFLPAAREAEVRSLIQGSLPTLRAHLAAIESLQGQR